MVRIDTHPVEDKGFTDPVIHYWWKKRSRFHSRYAWTVTTISVHTESKAWNSNERPCGSA